MIKPSTRAGLYFWITAGVPPGHFLTAVLSNDLREAVARADAENRAALPEIVEWLVSHAPMAAWGGPEVVRRWKGCRFTKEDETLWTPYDQRK